MTLVTKLEGSLGDTPLVALGNFLTNFQGAMLK
jgi:hypothetical protein